MLERTRELARHVLETAALAKAKVAPPRCPCYGGPLPAPLFNGGLIVAELMRKRQGNGSSQEKRRPPDLRIRGESPYFLTDISFWDSRYFRPL